LADSTNRLPEKAAEFDSSDLVPGSVIIFCVFRSGSVPPALEFIF
jgi:hypothetical protein